MKKSQRIPKVKVVWENDGVMFLVAPPNCTCPHACMHVVLQCIEEVVRESLFLLVFVDHVRTIDNKSWISIHG